eukprot:SM000156S02131  [mRNA]  locus=s156:139962:145079:+ [translate_table: standard]
MTAAASACAGRECLPALPQQLPRSATGQPAVRRPAPGQGGGPRRAGARRLRYPWNDEALRLKGCDEGPDSYAGLYASMSIGKSASAARRHRWGALARRGSEQAEVSNRVDGGFLRTLSSWSKEVAAPALGDLVSLRLAEDPSAVPTAPPPWPEAYLGLTGPALLKADIETVQGYISYLRWLYSSLRLPLQAEYDMELVAKYFMLRPHLIAWRLLVVTFSLGGILLQIVLNKAAQKQGQRHGNDEDKARQQLLAIAEKAKATLIKLGPTFIKVAQSLSSRPDIVGREAAAVLASLQDQLPPFSTKQAMALIEVELGEAASVLFPVLSREPIAAASFGQLGLLRKAARINSDLRLLADEFGHGLFGELDYTKEAKNAKDFAAAHSHVPFIVVPKVLPHLSSRRVLTMEWLEGAKSTDLHESVHKLKENLLDGSKDSPQRPTRAVNKLLHMVDMGVESSLVQLLETGVMHADPHPGNLLLTPDGRLGYLDFGLLTRLERRHQGAMLAAIAHLINRSWLQLAGDLATMDLLKPSTDLSDVAKSLEYAFGGLLASNSNQQVIDISFGQVAAKLWAVALKHRFRLPPYYTLVLRSLASLEGIALGADPHFKVFAAAYPYVLRRLLTDNAPATRDVLRNLVLTEDGEVKWAALSSLYEIARPNLSQSNGGLLEKGMKDSLASSIFEQLLSRSAAGPRRVLLQADVKKLVEVLLSSQGQEWRRKASRMIASVWTFKSAGHARFSARATSSKVKAAERLRRKRLTFLLRAVFERLRRHPWLQLRLCWTLISILTLACYEYSLLIVRTAGQALAGLVQYFVVEFERIKRLSLHRRHEPAFI